MRLFALPLLVLALAGCGAAPQKSAARDATQHTDAVLADAPQLIAELTDQKTVFECPKCGMMFDRAGQCSMGCGSLVETRVDYICPADNQPVAHAGKCERCAMNARVVKTAVALAELPPAVTGK